MTKQIDRNYTQPAYPGDFAKLPSAADNFAPAFLLTAACCRWPPSEARNAAIRAAAAEISDWNEFLSQVNRQRVAGIAHNALLAAGIELPPEIGRELASEAQRIVRHNLAFAAETVRLQHAFEAAGIPALVLKGVALAALAYESLGTKHARDIDLLVPADRAQAALQLLERDGYALYSPARHLNDRQRQSLILYGREAELVHSVRKIRLELHWRAADNPLLLQGVDAHSPAQSVAVLADASVRTLAADDLFAYLCVHGARHAWSRLKWLADVNALIAAPGSDIERLYRHAQQIGAGLCAGQTLLLCQRIFALQLPANLTKELSENGRMEKLVRIALAALTARRAETEVDSGIVGVTRFVHTQFLLGRGWKFYLAQCRAVSVGSPDIIRWPLPRYLHFLYPLIRLPLWLWRRARAALPRRSA